MIGCDVVEDDEVVGTISDIQRMVDIDYLIVDTDSKLVDAGFSKNFLLPYIERYVIRAEMDFKKVYVRDAKEILEAS